MSENTTTSMKHAALKSLSLSTKQNLHEMLRLANEILADPAYCESFGGEAQLLEHLEKNEFSHFGGNPSLSMMLIAYRANPQVEAWENHKYNIQAMIELARPVGNSPIKRTDWKALAKRLEAENKALRAEIADLKEQLASVAMVIQV